MIITLVNKAWFSWYPCCQQIIYDNGNEFNLHFEALCDTYGIKRKPTSVQNPTVNAILEHVHQVIMVMLHIAEIDLANTVVPSDIHTFLTDVAWAICSTYHTVLKASPGAAIFDRDMLFDIPFLADWNKIGDYRQCQTDLNTEHENCSCHYREKMVSSTNQRVGMNVILGLSHQFIQMGQLGFNAE